MKSDCKIRVLHYIGSLHFAGAQTFLMELYRSIDKTHILFGFIVFPEEQTGFYEEVNRLGGNIFVCPRYKGLNHLEFKNWWKTFFKAHAQEYDVFHVHQTATAKITMKIAKRYNLPIILHSHSKSNGRGMMAMIKDCMQIGVWKYADMMFGCSDEAGRYLFGEDAVMSSKYETLPNAINISKFAYCEEKRLELRKELGIANAFVLGNVGRFHEVKNQIFLIELLPKLKEIIPDIKLLLIGDGEERTKIEKRIEELEISEFVTLLGTKEDTENYYQCMDLFLMPSLYEGFGIVAIEAQASGLVCIVSADRVPKAINVTGNVIYLELDEMKWCEAIIDYKHHFKRGACDNITKMYELGFDSEDLTKRVSQKYIELSGKG